MDVVQTLQPSFR